MTMDERRLPIQVVIPRETDYSANKPGGSKKYLGTFTPELKNEIVNQCVDLQQTMQESFSSFPSIPCIGKVVMKEKAIAKSHKPIALFKANTCPIVGAERLDEILIKVTPQGLTHLINTAKSATSEDVKINMTKIKRIEPYSIRDKIGIENFEAISTINEPLKVKLFSFDDATDNQYYTSGFENLLQKYEVTGSRLHYGDNLCVYKVDCSDKEVLQHIIRYPGVCKVSFFPQYACEYPNIVAAQKELPNLPMPKDGEEYPIVGIIDSGVVPGHPQLEPWIFAREQFVPEEYRNYAHGTFVAGMLEYGNILNGFGEQQHCRILDACVFPNCDPEAGNTDNLSEYDLIERLHTVIGQYCGNVKVWNMSLGTNEICGDIISDFAVALDDIQDQYQVDIVLAAGNFTVPPLRAWPPRVELNNADKITTPADSIRAVAVGSVANIGVDHYVEVDRPSPFSRKGPGANYSIKPDVVHYGGNCTDSLNYDGSGVISFDVTGKLVEGVGTSYSAPIVTSLLGNLRHSVTEQRSREFAKAFLVHSAYIPETAKKEDIDYNKYYGFGIPKESLEDIMTCDQSNVTLIFSGTLSDGSFIEFNDFPYPKSLMKNGKCYGDIKMTLAYTPRRDAAFGQEYCRTNIDAHFGTYDYIDSEGTVVNFGSKVPLEKKWDEKFERSQVENGFKWNPLKSYRKKFKNGIEAKPWRLRVDSVARLDENYDGQEFVLFITIADPNQNDIYTEIIQMLRERQYIHYDVKINTRIRQTLGF